MRSVAEGSGVSHHNRLDERYGTMIENSRECRVNNERSSDCSEDERSGGERSEEAQGSV